MSEELLEQLVLDELSEESIEETMKTFSIPMDPRQWSSRNIDDWFYWMRHRLRFKFQKDISKDCINISANFEDVKRPELWIKVYGDKQGSALFREFRIWLTYYKKYKNSSAALTDSSSKSPPEPKYDSMEIDDDDPSCIDDYQIIEKPSTPHYKTPANITRVYNEDDEDSERQRKIQNSCQNIPRLMAYQSQNSLGFATLPSTNNNTSLHQNTKVVNIATNVISSSNNNNNNNYNSSNNSNNYSHHYNSSNSHQSYHTNFLPSYNRNRTHFSSIANFSMSNPDSRKYSSNNQIRSTLQSRILQQNMHNHIGNRGINRFKHVNSSDNHSYQQPTRTHTISVTKAPSYNTFIHKTIKDSRYSDKPKRRNEKKEGLYLWQTLLRLLSDPQYNSLISWVDKSRGTFKIIKPPQVAQIWGETKNNFSMSYDKMSRSMRQYYKTGLLKKESHDKLNYCFNMLDEHVIQFLSKCNEKLPPIRRSYGHSHRASSTPPSNASSSTTIPADASSISKVLAHPLHPTINNDEPASTNNDLPSLINQHQNQIDDQARITSPNSSITTTTSNLIESASSIISFHSTNSAKSLSSSPYPNTTTTNSSLSSALHNNTTSIHSFS